MLKPSNHSVPHPEDTDAMNVEDITTEYVNTQPPSVDSINPGESDTSNSSPTKMFDQKNANKTR